ncbi:sulfite exporter TauE/SafE family protein [Solemya velesiana gill symbiont]|uniref:sulfite exporter TauE/SafE family protein n=1 Tax=Solemya velesiana gill symbiont TaxID=1918948 RepID=UPI001FEADCE9|nr:sulfite exporter TauE/SafE family protein [Solemya velesiana gill symbiont]
MFELANIAIYLLLGSIAGLFAGLLGVGGGLIIVPALIWVFRGSGFSPDLIVHLAVGTSLATIVVTSISSVRAHHKRGAVLWKQVLELAPGIVVGAWIGAAVADYLPTLWLQRVFASFVIVVGLQMAFGGKTDAHRELPGLGGMSLAGGLIGMVSAIVGIGGGSMTVPFLNWCSVNIRNAVATSAACGLPIAVAGTIGFVVAGWGDAGLPLWSTGFVYWPGFLCIVCASVLLAPLGARMAHTLPVNALKRVFSVLLLVVGARMLIG